MLTHDTPSARKDHDAGWKHAVQVRAHFLSLNQDRMTRTVSEIVKDYEAKGEMVPIPAPMVLRIPPGGGGGGTGHASNMPPMPGRPIMMRPPHGFHASMMNPAAPGAMMRPPPAMMQMQMQMSATNPMIPRMMAQGPPTALYMRPPAHLPGTHIPRPPGSMNSNVPRNQPPRSEHHERGL